MMKGKVFHTYDESVSLPLFKRGKLGTSDIDCAEKFKRSHICLHSQAGNRL